MHYDTRCCARRAWAARASDVTDTSVLEHPPHLGRSGAHSQRKLTMLFYLEEAWNESHGGQLR
eukprot:scaffold264_cov317-Pinguiococcus_pyrenoidosus.AAC.18